MNNKFTDRTTLQCPQTTNKVVNWAADGFNNWDTFRRRHNGK